jgi:3-hydroxyacyl-CoA dehydrogenase/enoyl-CoA hydratase/3-hydroxybutyryl-CoA epimerase
VNGFQHLQLVVDEQRLAWLSLDVQGEPVNLLTPVVLAELARACTDIRSLNPRGLVVGSTKPGSFIAGADIKHITSLTSNEQALAFIRQGQAVCQQFEDLPCPTLAMIDGICLGGGMELALALDYRISSATPNIRLGLPEVKLGIHPGFGGTVRSISKLGVLNAMEIMLTGKLLRPQQAQAIGLVDNCVPAEHLHETAIQTLLKLPAKAKAPLHVAAISKLAPSRKLLAIKLRQQVAEQARPEHYPAP